MYIWNHPLIISSKQSLSDVGSKVGIKPIIGAMPSSYSMVILAHAGEWLWRLLLRRLLLFLCVRERRKSGVMSIFQRVVFSHFVTLSCYRSLATVASFEATSTTSSPSVANSEKIDRKKEDVVSSMCHSTLRIRLSFSFSCDFQRNCSLHRILE